MHLIGNETVAKLKSPFNILLPISFKTSFPILLIVSTTFYCEQAFPPLLDARGDLMISLEDILGIKLSTRENISYLFNSKGMYY